MLRHTHSFLESSFHVTTSQTDLYPNAEDLLGVALDFRNVVQRAVKLAKGSAGWRSRPDTARLEELQEALLRDVRELASAINEHLSDKTNVRALGQYQGDAAQRLLDALDSLLDYQDKDNIDSAENMSGVLQGMLYIARQTGKHPMCFTLTGLSEYSQHPVAAGGFGDVHRGVLHGEEVCLKIVKVYQTSAVEDILKTYVREATIWRYLNHPNVAPFYGTYYLDQHKTRLCLVSPWFAKGNLIDFIKANPHADRRTLSLDIARGIHYLHTRSIIHADLKGANILVTQHERACICDFGLASISESMAIRWTSLSAVGSRGSCRWQAPELFPTDEEHEVVNTRESDMYAFAGVLYELLTGYVPFYKLKSDAQVVLWVLQGKRPVRPTDIEDKVPDGFWTLMECCWAGEPSVRHTAGQVVAILESLVDSSNAGELPSWKKAFLIQASLRQPSPLAPTIVKPVANNGMLPIVSGKGDGITILHSAAPPETHSPQDSVTTDMLWIPSDSWNVLDGSHSRFNVKAEDLSSHTVDPSIPSTELSSQSPSANLKIDETKTSAPAPFMDDSNGTPKPRDERRIRGSPASQPVRKPTLSIGNGNQAASPSSTSPAILFGPRPPRNDKYLPTHATQARQTTYSHSENSSPIDVTSDVPPEAGSTKDVHYHPDAAVPPIYVQQTFPITTSNSQPSHADPEGEQPGSAHRILTRMPRITNLRGPPLTVKTQNEGSSSSPSSSISLSPEGLLFKANLSGRSPTAIAIPEPAASTVRAINENSQNRYKVSIRVVAEELKKRRDLESKSAGMNRRHNTKLWGSKVEEVTSPQGRTGLRPAHSSTSPAFKWIRGELIGRGRYGRVYLALNVTTGDLMAVKRIEGAGSDDRHYATTARALQFGLETLKDLDHPHIVQYLGYEEIPSDSNLNIFMEYVSGGSIGGCLTRYGKFAEDITKSFTAQILSGLEYLHSKGIPHRDLKANHVLVEVNGVCKISNFAMNRHANLWMNGTVFWMAPEVIHPDGGKHSTKMDIWSVGCVLLEMWTGQRPWAGDEWAKVTFEISQKKLAPPVPANIVLSEPADDFRRKCFVFDPNERPSAAELRRHKYLELSPGWVFTDFT